MVIDIRKVVFQSKVYPYASDYNKRFAKYLWDWVIYCMDARRPREEVIRQCDEAFLCINYVPDTGGIQLIETGIYGDTDIFDNVRLKAARKANALMPRGDRWIIAAAWDDEDPDSVRAVEDQQTWLHHEMRTRRQIQRHLTQKEVRGRSGVYWDWDETTVWKRITDRRKNLAALESYLARTGLSRQDAKALASGKYPTTIANGPIIQPIDWYDLWLDPKADLVVNRRPAKILRRFFSLEELKAARDPLTDEPIYWLPEGFKATDIEDILNNNDSSGGRVASLELLGTHLPIASSNLKQALVQVFICYLPFVEFDGEKYWDSYFYIAKNGGDGDSPVLMKIEENPSDLGHNHILVDDHIDWFTPTASGGISSVEKLVSQYTQKNLLKLLAITGAAHSIFPPLLANAKAFRDPNEISFIPGDVTLVDEDVLLNNAVIPMPSINNGVKLGAEFVRFMAEELRASAGVDGLVNDNAARTMSKPKTATEINRDTSSGNLVLDNECENDAELVNDLIISIWEASQVHTEAVDGWINYKKYLGDRVMQGRISEDTFRRPRSLHVLSQTGNFSKQAELDSILKGLEIGGLVSQTLGPQIMPFLWTGFIKAWKRLGIGMPEGVPEDPMQAMMMTQMMMGAAGGGMPPEAQTGAPAGAPPDAMPPQGPPMMPAPPADPALLQMLAQGGILGG